MEGLKDNIRDKVLAISSIMLQRVIAEFSETSVGMC
jgi:hypothetical protein